ncbi:MAG: helix-turn-helix domain-containing protein [Burkholderiales bacterium]|nr:helix-turn-helix domain-containing protein [Burkholderiales bacterium]
MTAEKDSALETARAMLASCPAAMTLDQAALASGFSRRTLNRWIARRELRIIKSAPGRSGRVVVPREELALTIAAHMTGRHK